MFNSQPESRFWRKLQNLCLLAGVLGLGAALGISGCASGGNSMSFSSLMPGNTVTSSQWEPEVDYQAEAQKEQRTAAKIP